MHRVIASVVSIALGVGLMALAGQVVQEYAGMEWLAGGIAFVAIIVFATGDRILGWLWLRRPKKRVKSQAEQLQRLLGARGFTVKHHRRVVRVDTERVVTSSKRRRSRTVAFDVLHIGHDYATPLIEDECIRRTQSQVEVDSGELVDVEALPIPHPPFEGIGAPIMEAEAYGRPALNAWFNADDRLIYLVEGLCQTHVDVHIARDFVVVALEDDGLEDSLILSAEAIIKLIEHMRLDDEQEETT